MADIISWIATAATIIAACMTAANLGSRITGYGFAVFTVGALCWIASGLMNHEPALVWTNSVLTVLDLFGVWRWLGRQARVEEGAQSAAEASEQTPGEALFPVSLLTRAAVTSGGEKAGTCVDAMAGCSSAGSPISSFRKAESPASARPCAAFRGARPASTARPWSPIIRAADIATLEELPKDHWPAQ